MQEILDKYKAKTKEQYFERMLHSETIGAIGIAKDMFAELNTAQLFLDFNRYVGNRDKLEIFLNNIK